jgi:tetratricopeptide (TPR) repeat protein
MGRKRKQTHAQEDQYGSRGSNDRDAPFQSRGGGLGGGKRAGLGAGGGRVSKSSLEYVPPSVPKFLHEHAHLLRGAGGGIGERGTGASSRLMPSGDHEEGIEDMEDMEEKARELEDDLSIAAAQNPELAEIHPELKVLAKKKEASELKVQANALFSQKKYQQAIDLYHDCIQLDPTDHVFYSNRAAAYIELGKFSQAVESARESIKCERGKRYAKGYFRLGAALLKLKEEGKATAAEAVWSLKKAKELEPDMRGIDDVLFRAVGMYEKEKRAGKGEEAEKMDGTGEGEGNKRNRKQAPSLLSFDEEDA